MQSWLMVAVGGALGAMARFGVNRGIVTWMTAAEQFPFATLLVNSLGAYCAGFLVVYLGERMVDGNSLRLLCVVGFLGAFTTFSAFSVETMGLISRGELTKALLNIGLNITLCLALCALGMYMAKR